MPIDIQDRVENHEQRITKIEIDGARLDARLEALVSSTNNLRIGMWVFSLIMLLTMVWQLLGGQGFRDVTQAVGLPTSQVQASPQK